ncbi:sialate O-acetylesterase [Sphingomonas sp. 1P08PE]|uniref:sialate O-acetylesterase n=1 Tax=Sphingomonas sp. 1P08PE TaxID=554122 RepID=UPI0039A118E3
MSIARRVRIALLVSTLALPSAAAAQTAVTAPTFAGIFGNHAVLQRDRPMRIWGRAGAGRPITVQLGERRVRVRADAAGRWRATLPAMPAGGPYALTAADGAAIATLTDIKVGDVYLCGGQSNMEFPARLSTNAWSGLGGSADDDLRFVNIAHDSQPSPLKDFTTRPSWRVVGPETVGDASAVCFYMARSLRRTQKVPIGLVHASWGGTTIQGWMTASSLATLPSYAPGLAAIDLLAKNPAAARASEDQRVEAWWDGHDPNAATQRVWRQPDYDDAGWPTLRETGEVSWKKAGVPALADFEGVVWLRSEIVLTDAQAQAVERLQLGPIDTYDTAWINGIRVAGGSVSWVWRDYAVPRGTLHAGRNVIALRVLGGGGLGGPVAQRGFRTTDGQLIPIAGWRYRSGMRATGLAVPAAPWDVPNSLVTLNNGMIAPLGPFGFKLAAWYQGESNAGAAAEYRRLLPLMMADWRRQFGIADLPFLVVQLTSFGTPSSAPGQSDWAQLRDAQARAVAADPHAALVTTIDVGDRYDIHPTQKTVVGERLARAARAVAYGAGTAPGGPTAVRVTRKAGDLVVDFRDSGGGLRTYSSDVATGFEACSASLCRYVSGRVAGDAIVLPGADRPEIVRVRYAWADAPYVNLFGAEDLPVAPFDLPVN